jgi:hypothetical protein
MYTATYPDGLTPDLIDALISECLPGPDPLTEALTDTRRVARAVLDATTLDRRHRRVVRRDLAAAVRALPTRPLRTAPEADVA